MSNPATVAHLEQVIAYYQDPAQAPHRHPPRPPTPEIGYELAAVSAQLAAILLDYQLTGQLHKDNPCPEAVLAAGELMDKAFDGKLQYSDALAVARRFGYEGD